MPADSIVEHFDVIEDIGTRKLAPVMAFPYYQNMSDEDLDALIVYLRSIPAQPQE